jgi:hypothetical protein
MSERLTPQKFIEVPRIEAPLEDWARLAIASAGGLMLKVTQPGRRGFPDDAVFWWYPLAPAGFRELTHWLEFKRPDGAGEVSANQDDTHRLFECYGRQVILVESREWVEEYIRAYSPRLHAEGVSDRSPRFPR